MSHQDNLTPDMTCHRRSLFYYGVKLSECQIVLESNYPGVKLSSVSSFPVSERHTDTDNVTQKQSGIDPTLLVVEV